jgi:Domain of unknown function (DUF4136)
MRLPKIFASLVFLLSVATIANAQNIYVDYDHHVSFSTYKTFMWISKPHYHPDPVMDGRIVDAINSTLMSKGLQLVPEGGDIGVAVHVATRERHTLETFYTGFGGGWHWHFGTGFGTAFTTAEPYEVGTIVVDLFDTRTKEIIWRGVASDSLSEKPEKDTKKLEKAIDKLFRRFPPE